MKIFFSFMAVLFGFAGLLELLMAIGDHGSGLLGTVLVLGMVLCLAFWAILNRMDEFLARR